MYSLRKIAKESDFGPEGEIKLTGTLIHYDQENLNGRIYTKEAVENIVEQFNKKTEEEKFLGELGYPQDDFTGINIGNISHEVESIHLNEEDKTLVGTFKILNTPKGEIVKELLKNNVGISCRPRGVGNINENKEVEDFQLLSFDIVTGPDSFANIKEDDYLTLFEEDD